MVDSGKKLRKIKCLRSTHNICSWGIKYINFHCFFPLLCLGSRLFLVVPTNEEHSHHHSSQHLGGKFSIFHFLACENSSMKIHAFLRFYHVNSSDFSNHMHLELTSSSVTQSMMQLKHTHTKRSDWPSNEIWHEKMSLPLYIHSSWARFFLLMTS